MARLHFPPATLKKMKDLGVTESEASDVFNFGTPITFKNGTKAMEKKFMARKILIGLMYVSGNANDSYTVTTVWKRDIV